MEAGEHEPLKVVFTSVTSSGERIELDKDVYEISAGTSETLNISVVNWDPDAGLFTIELSAYDQYGRELETVQEEAIARETGWNIGISSLTTDGDITVGIKRSGYTLLAEAVCELRVEAAGGWSTTYIVDIAYSEYAPLVFIENPKSIERDEKITATLGCSVPFDIDDDPEDNSMSSYYKTESVLAVSTNDVGWIVGVAGLVLALSWLLGVLQSPTNQPKPVGRKRSENAASTQTDSDQTPSSEPVDDIQIQPDTEEQGEEAPEVEDEQNIAALESTIEVIESIQEIEEEETDASASGRLASLREEMGTDDAPAREGSLEDRMKDFFGGK